ncbi:hypothetical protein F4814DRAFT_431477 [Daldinia grandis]|nr:hypothetical protein F4814DRAFT_431477 [Daldinia grandis]
MKRSSLLLKTKLYRHHRPKVLYLLSIYTIYRYSPPPIFYQYFTYYNKMSSNTQNIAQRVRDSQPQMFLSLAPTTSASYPTAQSIKPALHARRSSSQSSVGSASSLRFLKLGPVHYGEHPGEHKEDFHEVAVE